MSPASLCALRRLPPSSVLAASANAASARFQSRSAYCGASAFCAAALAASAPVKVVCASFEASIERKINFMVPFDQRAAANAAKLGQTFADANRSAKAGIVIRDIAKAIVGVSDEEGTDLAQTGAGGSLLGKFDLKSLLAKKEKGGAKQSEPAE